jgi:hypothetical protein
VFWSRGYEHAEVGRKSLEVFCEKCVQPSSATCVPTLVEAIDYDNNRTDDIQVPKWFQDEGFEQGTIVSSATSKIDVVLYDLSERNLKRRIAIGEMASKSRKQMIGLPY